MDPLVCGSLPSTMTNASFMNRKPRRINVTVPEAVLEQLQAAADREGRSLSSLCSHLLEVGIQQRDPVG
jgi:predicted HicB family RNase H-like nuclease